MGHYDDCYASDDYHKMKPSEKKSYFQDFQAEMDDKGRVHAYYEDVGGWLLKEWAEANGYEIKNGYKDITVVGESLYVKALKAVKGE